MHRNSRMMRGESSANFCRRMGWTPGTVLVGDEGYGPMTIEITAVGERGILARRPYRNVYSEYRDSSDGLWTLGCREWQRIAGYWGA